MNRKRHQLYPITPVPKPRMTRGDKFQKRPRGCAYRAFCDEVRIRKVHVPEAGSHITFTMPMPKSWSNKKRAEMDGKPHQQTPDVDNLQKALMDAVFDDDSHVYDMRVTKVWGREGAIIVEEAA